MQPQDRQPQDTWQRPTIANDEFHLLADGSAPTPVSDSIDTGELAESVERPVIDDEQATEDDETQTVDFASDQVLLRWQAVAGIDRHRPAVWYLVFAAIVLGLVAVAIFVVNSVTFAVLIPVMAAALIVYARRPPAPINYTVSQRGIHINDHLVSYASFKSFNVIQHDGTNMINLIPKKRFSITETLYFPTEIGEALVDTLAARLPLKEAKPDLIDRLVSRLRL